MQLTNLLSSCAYTCVGVCVGMCVWGGGGGRVSVHVYVCVGGCACVGVSVRIHPHSALNATTEMGWHIISLSLQKKAAARQALNVMG